MYNVYKKVLTHFDILSKWEKNVSDRVYGLQGDLIDRTLSTLHLRLFPRTIGTPIDLDMNDVKNFMTFKVGRSLL